MIYRLSQKLGDKINETPRKSCEQDENPFLDWSGHLFAANRVQYVILTNTVSLFSVIFYGKGINDANTFIKTSSQTIRDHFEDQGLEHVYLSIIAEDKSGVRFSKPLNRSVIASVHDLVLHAKYHLMGEDLSPYDVSVKVNELPLCKKGYINAREGLKLLRL